ncbi:MAG: hypothetical protein H7Y38_19540 [Armatimonadetes bacterium]|nr:hypothetical protein [Armatimonadota bacterium]
MTHPIETRILLIAALTLVTISASHAQQTYITSDRTVASGNPFNTTTAGTINIGITAANAALVPGVNVDIVAPANALGMIARSTSRVNMTGGMVQGFQLFDDAQFTVSGGTTGNSSIGYVTSANDRSRITVTGGTFQNGFGLTENAVGEVVGGTFNKGMSATGDSRLTIRAGTFNAVGVQNAAVADIYDGTFRYSTTPSSQSGSPVPVSSGVDRGGTLNIYGGNFAAQMMSVSNLSGQTGSNINIVGGNHGRLHAFNAGVFNVSGGVFNNSLICSFGSAGGRYGEYNFFGTGFSLTNARAFTLTDQYVNQFTGTMYDLRGTLADGNAVVSRYFVQNQTVAQGASQGVNGISFSAPVVVPEASTFALCVPPIVVLSMAVLRRSESRNESTETA